MSDPFARIATERYEARCRDLIAPSPIPAPRRPLPLSARLEALKPANKLTTPARLRKELATARKAAARFLRELAPPVTSTRTILDLDRFDWREETRADRRDFTGTLAGRGKWSPVRIPHYGPPLGRAVTYYRTTFKLARPALRRGALFAVFDGVDYKAHVFVNGAFLGSHEGFFAPFEFDFTAQARAGENVLLVKVENDYVCMGSEDNRGRTLDGEKIYAASGLGYDDPEHGWHHCPPAMGICQGVRIEARPRLFIRDLFVRPLPGENRAEAWVEVYSCDLTQAPVSFDFSLFGLGYSMFTIPYTAQGYELSTDYNERTHIFQWRQYAAAATGFFSPWLPFLCLKLDVLGGGVPARGAAGVHWVSLGIAATILLTACAPIFGCAEGQRHREEDRVPFPAAVKLTLQNWAFWPLVLGNLTLKFGMIITGVFFYYVMIYHTSGGEMTLGAKQWGIFCNTINVATFLAMAPVVRVTDRLGKKPTLLLLLVLGSLTYASVWFTLRPQTSGWFLNVASFLQNVLYVPGIIANIWPCLLTGAGIGVFCNSMPLIMNSMLADVCDVDELASGHQRQAFYSAAFVTCDKLALGLGLFLQGLMLTFSGFNAMLARQAPETIAYWMNALLFTQPVGFLLAFAFVLFFPVTRAKALEVRHQLDARRSPRPQGATGS
jgi:Na+/melibiose symporter-like transporter